MDRPITHIIVTRYNIRTNFAGVDANAIRSNKDWLVERRGLFDKFCLPSIRSQTSKNFLWFVLFDKDTPAEFTDYFGDAGTPLMVGSAAEGHEAIIEHVGRSTRTPFVTTRLDNDDALSVHYVETTQAYASGIMSIRGPKIVPHVLNFRTGYEIDINEERLFKRDYPGSSFFSMIEGEVEADKLQFASLQHHAQVAKSFPSTNVSTQLPFWLMVIHKRNVGNKIQGQNIEFSKEALASNFGVEF